MKTLIRLYRSVALLFVSVFTANAEVREAVAYLQREVPKWKRDNGCYSCHNDGDGLRALLVARRAGIPVNAAALNQSLPALVSPSEWESKPLARLQFAAAIREAVAAGLVDPANLASAAETVAADQQSDGHWMVDEELAVGSPVTYGPVLATHLAREVLTSANRRKHQIQIAKATRWLERRKPGHLMETAVLALSLHRNADLAALGAAQSQDGSWGGEPFDTALARMALGPAHPASIKARAWLLKTQWSGGGWPATTRPGGGDSYAQHISTTAWVLISFAVTEPEQ